MSPTKRTRLVLLLVLIAAGYVFVAQPYILTEERRSSTTPERVTAVYYNVTGDALCAKLYIVEPLEGDKPPVASSRPLFLALPVGLPSPEDGAFAYPDNVFALEGFRYDWVEANQLTGQSTSTLSNRFDVISWKVKTPYRMWREPTDAQTIEEPIVSSEPVSYSFSGDSMALEQFSKRNYIDCRK